jgi:hypothetical protein
MFGGPVPAGINFPPQMMMPTPQGGVYIPPQQQQQVVKPEYDPEVDNIDDIIKHDPFLNQEEELD